MTGKAVAEITAAIKQDAPSAWVTHIWESHRNQMAGVIEEWLELRNYVFATDTTTTSNSTLPWKNTVTRPKLCQIRDNLHANYLSALFPNDEWLKWVGQSQEDSVRAKRDAIQNYMSNKARENNSRSVYSKLLLDYIDTGNAFVMDDWEANYKEHVDGTLIPDYVGPVPIRISPLDIVFNPLANSFKESYKIIRSIKSIGELKKLAQTNPSQSFWKDVIKRREDIRNLSGGYSKEDFEKSIGYSVDGFGNMHEYYQSDFVEVLEFYGDYHDAETGELHTNKVLTVVDRSFLARSEDFPSWLGHAPIYHAAWRGRPDNLWGMGPLANIVGLQYRIDHLENSKADALDLIIHPVTAIVGNVEEFTWEPGAEVHLDEGGTVTEVSKSLNGVIAASNDIQELERTMEQMAGAPSEAMGIRTPGEKTAFEVGELQNKAGRIFQEKITNFEINLLEPNLNSQLESARRNLDGTDIIRVMDDDIGVERFVTVTAADITAAGVLRPVGARHFAKQAQDLQNVIGIFNSPIGQMVAPHTSGLALTKFVEDITNVKAYGIFKPNVAVEEQQQTQTLMQEGQDDQIMNSAIDTQELGL